MFPPRKLEQTFLIKLFVTKLGKKNILNIYIFVKKLPRSRDIY